MQIPYSLFTLKSDTYLSRTVPDFKKVFLFTVKSDTHLSRTKRQEKQRKGERILTFKMMMGETEGYLRKSKIKYGIVMEVNV